jgi:hypothetical protein
MRKLVANDGAVMKATDNTREELFLFPDKTKGIGKQHTNWKEVLEKFRVYGNTQLGNVPNTANSP